MIRNGLAAARLQTLGHFTGTVLRELEMKVDERTPVVAQEFGPRT
jgi:hypothetical protein